MSKNEAISPLKGKIQVPADKSICHRAIMFSPLAHGVSEIAFSSCGRDNLATLRIMQQLGVSVSGVFTPEMAALAREEDVKNIEESSEVKVNQLTVEGRGIEALTPPSEALDCGNSGTTGRLLTGLLSGCHFLSTLIGDESLTKRPFKRVTEPLSEMGARFSGTNLPLEIEGGPLGGILYQSPRASAQVKSALLLAGLRAQGITSIEEPMQSRDHTERMFGAMGIELSTETRPNGAWRVTLDADKQSEEYEPLVMTVPGDYSSASFLLVAASIISGSSITIEGVGVNPSRTGLEHILKSMGADISHQNLREEGGEPVADILVNATSLRSVSIDHDEVVLAIDEIPVLAVAAAFASGVTKIRGAEELRV